MIRSDAFLVLADDLTGAGDSAIMLLQAGEEADVFLDGLPASDAAIARVAAVDLHTRDLSVEDASRLVASAAASVPPGRAVFKKIDSTLRGHIGAELAALHANLPKQDLPVVCIVAPAFPDLGRTLEDGVLHIHGKPADPAALWYAGAGGCRDGLAAELRSHGFNCISLSLAQTREENPASLTARMANGLASTRPAIVCDARDNEDMRRIAAAASRLPARCVWVGSGGLAQALAAVLASDNETAAIGVAADAVAPVATVLPEVAGGADGFAFMVGSFSAVAGRQVQELLEAGGCVHVAVPADELIGQITPATRQRIEQSLQDKQGVVLAIAAGEVMPELSRHLSAGMAALAAGLLPRLSALICCGGDTSRALLDHIGARRLRVAPCAEPGVTLAWSATHPALRLAMKAGAFGDAQALVRLRTELKGMPPPAAPAHT